MTMIQKLKGFRDFLPDDARKRRWLKDRMIEVAERWGYEPLETPTLEPLELFTGQIGEDEKLFFSFTDAGGRKVAMRYDQTVPTVRVLGEYANTLTLPFRRYQYQQAFRAEKPQKGRYREFTQFDIDIFGVASPLADAEVIASNLEICKNIGFSQAIAVVSSRSLLSGMPYEAVVAIDKLNKIGEAGVIADMESKGISHVQAQEYLEFVKNLKPNDEIRTIFYYLENAGFGSDWYRFEPTLTRSFSYSQGPIWEIVIPQYDAGSIGGGERYDGMIKKITGLDIPGTGIAFGFDRTLEAADACGLVPKFVSNSSVLVTVFSPDLMDIAIKTAQSLREGGLPAELYPDPSVKLEKQLRYADRKNIPFAIITGPDEASKATLVLKNMITKTQNEFPVDGAAAAIKSALNNNVR
ncbi:histidine--tRNA ligase [Candidatus Gottesmanbacteria bacterium RBG_16_52_11]|uniref:Histidine--tRNA ligase n=1 Tax=Candidatus Gottesmanbacteria bacterium RBG_16_52_11 TaxID=1798374 RepID=A0A1F5YPG2_9BACT|nr:MAG: histidine--tRNA ligase [Candidatus Gottesmanbacteria bacterium RBG_16_52_11]